MNNSRRVFITDTTKVVLGGSILSCSILANCAGKSSKIESEKEGKDPQSASKSTELFFKISLAQWSLNKALFAGELDHLDFAKKSKEDFGIDAIEYVNQFFKDKASNKPYLNEMNLRATDLGVEQLLIMVDGEGGLAELDDKTRNEAVENHYKWIEAAKHLGCHSIRVNAFGVGSEDDVANAAVDGLGKLATFASDYNLNVIVENHGDYSSNGKWLAGVMHQINMTNCGTLPDFGNFCIKRDKSKPIAENCIEEYDRYLGVEELMTYAKAVSAKTHDFNSEGNEIHTDYSRMLKIVKDAGYRGYIGIEYEGDKLKADEGIRLTKALMERAGKQQ